MLLGLLREDKALTNRFLGSNAAIEAVRKEIERHARKREKIPTAVDLPLSGESKRVLAYTADEAERLSQKHIGTEHILLGLLREDKCIAARILHESDLFLSTVREEVTRMQSEKTASSKATALVDEFSRDVTQEAMDHVLDWPIGRDNEVERLVQILCRRDKNKPLLLGEPGVGKTAIVEGLAQRIANDNVPLFLSDKRILALDLSLVVAGTKSRGEFEGCLKAILKELIEARNVIIFIDNLHTPVEAGFLEGALDPANILKPAFSSGEIQAIGATTPTGYRRSIEKNPWFADFFLAVNVLPLSEVDALKMLFYVKDRYERFHRVVYTDKALEAAVYYSKRYIADRALPATAVDVIDEAGARVKLRQSRLTGELVDTQKRINFIVRRMEVAIANHEFERARFYSDEERRERDNLRLLGEMDNIEGIGTVTREDIEVVVADWAGMPITSIREEPATG